MVGISIFVRGCRVRREQPQLLSRVEILTSEGQGREVKSSLLQGHLKDEEARQGEDQEGNQRPLERSSGQHRGKGQRSRSPYGIEVIRGE